MQIVSRAEWGARPPKTTPRRITIPTPELWLHHTASPTGYEARIRAIQNFHMDTRGWNDIAYSYLINHEGTVYEGRGAGIAGGHTAGHNTISHAVCLLGDFDQAQPTDPALSATVELVRHGLARGWWSDQFTGGHRDASGANTSCPGTNLHRRIPEINQAIKGDDDMVLKQVLKGQTSAFYREMQARTGVPAGDAAYWGSDDPRQPAESEWDNALDDFVGALFQMAVWPPKPPAAPAGLTEAQVRELASSEILRRLSNG